MGEVTAYYFYSVQQYLTLITKLILQCQKINVLSNLKNEINQMRITCSSSLIKDKCNNGFIFTINIDLKDK